MDIFQLPILGDFLRHEWQKGNYFTQIHTDLGIVSQWNFGPPIFITTSGCSLYWPNGTFWTEFFAGYFAVCHVSEFLSIHQVSTRMPRYTPRKLTVRTRKLMVGRLLSFWQGLFSGSMVGFLGVYDWKKTPFQSISLLSKYSKSERFFLELWLHFVCFWDSRLQYINGSILFIVEEDLHHLGVSLNGGTPKTPQNDHF